MHKTEFNIVSRFELVDITGILVAILIRLRCCGPVLFFEQLKAVREVTNVGV